MSPRVIQGEACIRTSFLSKAESIPSYARTMRRRVLIGCSPPLLGRLSGHLVTDPALTPSSVLRNGFPSPSQASHWLILHFYNFSSGPFFGNLPRLPALLPRVWKIHTFYPRTVAGACHLLLTACPELLPLAVFSPPVRAPITHQGSKMAAPCLNCTVLTAPLSTQPNLPGGSLSLFPHKERALFQEMHLPSGTCVTASPESCLHSNFLPSTANHQIPLCNFPVSVQTLEH